MTNPLKEARRRAEENLSILFKRDTTMSDAILTIRITVPNGAGAEKVYKVLTFPVDINLLGRLDEVLKDIVEELEQK